MESTQQKPKEDFYEKELTAADKEQIQKILKQVQTRAETIKKQHPNLPKCLWCENCVDITPLLGQDTVCPYHRLLHDEFFYECGGSDIHPNMPYTNVCKTIDEYRTKYKEWMTKLGQEQCDLIVANKALYPINWQC